MGLTYEPVDHTELVVSPCEDDANIFVFFYDLYQVMSSFDSRYNGMMIHLMICLNLRFSG